MIEIWYALVALSLIAFAVNDGRNFGVGALLHALGYNAGERRAIMGLIESSWSWDEVWLVAAFGSLFLAFPKVLAIGLSGYYLAVFLLLWSLIVRGIALEMAAHVEDALWRGFWDALVTLASILLAIFFGAAFGNVVRGVPLGADGRMFLPFFTDFSARGTVGILDWYTILVALFTLALLAAHGATFVAHRATGAIAERANRAARRAWWVVLALLPVVSSGTRLVRPDFFTGIIHHAPAWPALLAIVLGLGAVFLGLRQGMERIAWIGSCWCIAGLLGGAAASIFPVMLRSTIMPAYSVTAYGGATARYGLGIALVWWPIAAALGICYWRIVARRYQARMPS
ncbi:MAG TPA: cytochrome d ubiquinol oxidase subunit II [Gemmatimonadales bacterium]